MRNLTARSLPALAIAGLMLIPAPDAAAHETAYPQYRDRPAVHIAYHRAYMPRWLRQHNDFAIWYSLNYAGIAVDVNWRRMYRRYEGDYYYHRHYKKRHKAKHYNAHYRDRHYNEKRYKKDKHYKKRQKRDRERRRH